MSRQDPHPYDELGYEVLGPDGFFADRLDDAEQRLEDAEARADELVEAFERSLRDSERELVESWQRGELRHATPPEPVRPLRDALPGALDDALSSVFDTLGTRPGARSCRWCRELIVLDFDHDFCEPDDADDLDSDAPELWRDQVTCIACMTLHPFTVQAPPQAQERNLESIVTIRCVCGVSASLAYSWRQRRVVGARYQRRIEHGATLPYEPVGANDEEEH